MCEEALNVLFLYVYLQEAARSSHSPAKLGMSCNSKVPYNLSRSRPTFCATLNKQAVLALTIRPGMATRVWSKAVRYE